jgi:hypothetical protein
LLQHSPHHRPGGCDRRADCIPVRNKPVMHMYCSSLRCTQMVSFFSLKFNKLGTAKNLKLTRWIHNSSRIPMVCKISTVARFQWNITSDTAA